MKSKKIVTIVGSDGSGKSTLAFELLKNLRKKGITTGIIHLPRYKEVGGYPKFFGKYFYGFISNIAEKNNDLRLKIVSLILNAINMLTPISFLMMLSKDIIIEERNPIIDTKAMSFFYAPNVFLACFLSLLSKIGSKRPDCIVFVDIDDPTLAYKRITSRKHKATHLHERNTNQLKIIQRQYKKIIDNINKEKILTIRIDGKNKPSINSELIMVTLESSGII